MANENRTIQIDADASGAQQAMDTLRMGGEKMYQGFRQEAEKYSDTIKGQKQFIQDQIRAEKERLSTVIDGNRMELDMQTQIKLSKLDPSSYNYEVEKNKILEDQKRKLKDINQEYKEQRQVIREANRAFEEGYRGKEDPTQPPSGGGGRGGALGVGGAMLAGAAGGSFVSMVSALPWVGQMLATPLRAAMEQEEAQYTLRAMTGRKATFGRGAQYGITTTEMAQMQREIARVSGVGGAGLEQRTLDQLAAEKAFGLQQGQLTGLAQFERMGAGDPMQLVQMMAARAANSDLWDIELDGGQIKGFASLGEKMDAMGSLMQREAEISETFTGQRSADVLAAFGQLGGGFEDSRGLGRIMSLDQAIRGGGGNEFMEAEILGALAKENPEMSLFRLRQQRAQGIFGEGNLASILERAQQVGGVGGENTQAFLSVLAPELLQNREALEALSMADPELFRNLTGAKLEEILKQYGIDKEGIQGRAVGAKGGIETIDTAMRDSIAKLGVTISERIEDPLKNISKEIIGFAGDPNKYWEGLTNGIEKKFDTMINKVGDKIVDKIANPLGLDLEVSGGEALKNSFKNFINALSTGATSQFNYNVKVTKGVNPKEEKDN